jgi:hypothetical protein
MQSVSMFVVILFCIFMFIAFILSIIDQCYNAQYNYAGCHYAVGHYSVIMFKVKCYFAGMLSHNDECHHAECSVLLR